MVFIMKITVITQDPNCVAQKVFFRLTPFIDLFMTIGHLEISSNDGMHRSKRRDVLILVDRSPPTLIRSIGGDNDLKNTFFWGGGRSVKNSSNMLARRSVQVGR